MMENILEQAGLYLVRDFICRTTCQTIVSNMETANLEEGKVLVNIDDRKKNKKIAPTIDKSLRSVHSSLVEEEWVDLVRNQFLENIDFVSDHYGLELRYFSGPNFLVYRKGDFYVPHSDNGGVDERAVTVVVQLSDQVGDSATYKGGMLSLYAKTSANDILELPVIVNPGVLVTFPSETIHSVSLVTQGTRYSVIGWYCC